MKGSITERLRDTKYWLETAVRAAEAAGQLMRQNLRTAKTVMAEARHDIKLELDVRCQKRIETLLRRTFPHLALLGEEGVAGDPAAEYRWVVDPIDGTVNFAYGIPHACVSIALQRRIEPAAYRCPDGTPSRITDHGSRITQPYADGYQTEVGVVYDPFCRELWTVVRGQPARLNGRVIQVSPRRRLRDTIVSLGFAKQKASLNQMLPGFQDLVHRVRKIRIMGSAALDLVYVATGRMDAYVEAGVRLWDVAAGGLIVEGAGGHFGHQQLSGEHFYRIVATNGWIRRPLEKLLVRVLR